MTTFSDTEGCPLPRPLSWLVCLFLLFLIFLPYECAWSQNNVVRLHHLESKNGLSHDIVYSLHQDRKGYVWLGTLNGLDRYDGRDIQSYRSKESDSSSISSSLVWSISQLADGRLVLGTQKGVDLFDTGSNRAERLSVTAVGDGSCAAAHLVHVNRQGNILVGTQNRLLLIDSTLTGTEILALPEPTHPPGRLEALQHRLTSLVEDQQGYVWLGTREVGLLGLARNEDSYMPDLVLKSDGDPKMSLNDDFVRCLAIDSSNAVWIGTRNGVNRLDPDRLNVVNISVEAVSSTRDTRFYANALGLDSQGKLWLITRDSELLSYREVEGRFVAPEQVDGLQLLAGPRFLKAASGQMWAGCNQGLTFFSVSESAFNTVQENSTNAMPGSLSIISAIESEENGNTWLTARAGLTLLDQRGAVKQVFSDGRSQDYTFLSKGMGGNFWVATDRGVLSFSLRDRRFKTVVRMSDLNPEHPPEKIRAIVQDHSSRIWLGTSGGLYEFDLESGEVRGYYHQPEQENTLSHTDIYSLYLDDEKFMWIASAQGLDRMSMVDSGIERVIGKYGKLPREDISHIWTIYEDRLDRIWLGTHTGIFYLSKDTWTIHQLSGVDNLDDLIIYAMREDLSGRLWISSGAGLFVVTFSAGQSGQFESYERYEPEYRGRVAEFAVNVAHMDASGTMFFGGDRGLCFFKPDELSKREVPSPTLMTNFLLDNKRVSVGERLRGQIVLDVPLDEIEELKLSYRENNFGFEYTTLDYNPASKVKYAYLLSGLDKDWNYVDQRRNATYTNVPPGEYVFKLKRSLNSGPWQELPHSVTVSLSPPFWNSWWFRITALLGVVLLVRFVHQSRLRLLQIRASTLERKVVERTAELLTANESLKREIAVRREVDKQLQASLALLRDTFEATVSGILVVNTSGEVVTYNRKFLEMWSLPADFLSPGDSEKKLQILSDKIRDPALFKERVRELYKMPAATSHDIVYRTDGRVFDRYSQPQIVDGQTVGRVWSFHEITDLKRIEAALRDSEQRYRAIMEQASEGIYLADLDSRQMIEANAPYLKLLDYTLDEFRQLSIYDVVDHDKGSIDALIERLKIEKRHYVGERKHRRKDGHTIDVEVSLSLIEHGDKRTICVIVGDLRERKRAEETIRSREKRLRLITDAVPVCISYVDEHEVFRFNNKTYEDWFGLSREEIEGSHMRSILGDEQYSGIKGYLQSTLKGKTISFENEATFSDKRVRYLRTNFIPDRSPDGSVSGLYILVTDVSNTKKAERQLRASEERWQSLAENTPDLIIVVNRMLGIQFINRVPQGGADSMIGTSLNDFVLEAYHDLVSKSVASVFESGMPEQIEIQAPGAGGEICWYSNRLGPIKLNGDVTSVAFIATDITQQKRTERALRNSEERYRHLLEAAQEGILVLDVNGKTTYANPRMAEMIGYSIEEIENLPLSKLLADDGYDIISHLLASPVERDSSVDASLTRKDGGWLDASIHLSLLLNEDSSPNGFLAIIIDISERKMMETALRTHRDHLEDLVQLRTRKLRQANSQLEIQIEERRLTAEQLSQSREELRNLSAYLESAREEERKRISREIHDELGQVLSALKLDLVWLEAYFPPDGELLFGKTRAMSKHIESAIGTVQRITEELRPALLDDLGFTAAVSWKLEDFEERSGIGCNLCIQPPDFELEDERSSALFRVFTEAITNIARHSQATKVEVRLEKHRDRLILSVSDNGVGIRQKEIEAPTAFGLIGMRERILNLDGSIDIKNNGQGTLITVKIPI